MTIPYSEVADPATLPDKVFVYRNLHKNVYSVRDTKTGRVVLHTKNITLSYATFVVGEKGRQRVIQEGRKNVHAGVRGQPTVTLKSLVKFHSRLRATYNPYKYETFVDVDTEEPVVIATLVHLGDEGVRYW